MSGLVDANAAMSSSASSSYISARDGSQLLPEVDDLSNQFNTNSDRHSSPSHSIPHPALQSAGTALNTNNINVRTTASARTRAAADAKGSGIQQSAAAAPNAGTGTTTTATAATAAQQQRRHVDPTDTPPQSTATATTAGASTTPNVVHKPQPTTTTTPVASSSFTAGAAPRQQQQQAQSIDAWAEKLAQSYFTCFVCKRVATDAVQLVPGNMLACRVCASSVILRGGGALMHELPLSVSACLKEIISRSQETAAADPAAVSKATLNNNNANSLDDIAKRRMVQPKRAVPNNNTTAKPNMAWSRELTQLVEAESTERLQIEKSEHAERERRRRTMHTSSGHHGKPNSRLLKAEADKKYEQAEYTAAIELYTKAIQLQLQDGSTQVQFLYGNRSAAHYMAQRYEECISDCLKVVKADPGNVKMLVRAARSAATMGDLRQAIKILSDPSVPPLTEATLSDLKKYKAGLDLFEKAEREFGTASGDERYRMLVAQFSDTVPFRLRLAESLAKQKQYAKAVETLEVVSSWQRPPALCRVLADCLFRSGFEHFDKARHCIKDAAQFDDDCAALLKTINMVDDGKQRGNTAFADKKFSVAVDHYTAAINVARDNEQILRILYCNRAAAHKEVGKYREGVEDCTKALAIDKDFFKAYARRARCHQLLGNHIGAVQDFQRAMKYDSSDRELARELREAETCLHQEKDREKDYYFQLGISRTATEREIKAKYREMSLRWHPDKCVSMEPAEKERAEHKFKVINEAYNILSDPVTRRDYDMTQDRAKRPVGGYGFSSTYSADAFRGTAAARPRAGPGKYW